VSKRASNGKPESWFGSKLSERPVK
jgi:hypothetical protein